MQTQVINLDMTPGGIPPVAHVSQGDTGARKLYFRILDNGALFDVTGLTAVLTGRKPDGTMFSYSCDVYQYSIQRSCTEQMTAVAGDVLCELRLLNDEGLLGTANFILDVEEDPTANAVASESEITEFKALSNAASGYAANAANSASQAATSAANAAQSAQNVANAYRLNPVTSPGQDIDNYGTTGFYYFTAANAPANAPEGSTSGLLFVTALTNAGMSSELYVKQIWMNQGAPSWKIYERIKGGSPAAWGQWFPILTTPDIIGAISGLITNDLTASRALVSSAGGKVAASDITALELSYLHGLTEPIDRSLSRISDVAQIANSGVSQIMPTLGTQISNIGDSSVSVPTGTLTTLGSFTLQPGLWVVFVSARWSNPGEREGSRQIHITRTAGTDSAVDYGKSSSIRGVPNHTTIQHIPAVFSISTATTFYVTGYQSSGVSITVSPRIQSVRLGDGSRIA